ncbi:pyridoxamine 5'-phosphate oxidase family protein [Actinomadura vinacea]|uniref:Pyridoxamine 5'-phosphate oxidase family protein n=1 Tax=Actinomadura vinacea TaxID=115336 RepID=A0ABP5X549_9ACTN
MGYHPGERLVQERAGRIKQADHSLRAVRRTIPAVAASFLARQPMIVIGAADGSGRLWATQLTGPPGFVRADGEHTVEIAARPGAHDPLSGVLDEPQRIGMIAIEPDKRRRMRINGTARPAGDGLLVTADQVYANCPKYIQRREPTFTDGGAARARRGTGLTAAQRERIGRADTFFVATADDQGDADASHRGGNPGFVRVLGPDRLCWPDYLGNSMFMTLGNLQARPQAGLLFPDWTTGAFLHVSGTAEVDWSPRPDMPGAERLVRMTVTDVVDVTGASPLRWSPPEYSRFNPPAD